MTTQPLSVLTMLLSRHTRRRELSRCSAARTSLTSFDHLVGGHLHDQRHREAERLGRMQVDGEFELGRLQHRKLCRLSAIDDAAGISPDLTESVRKICPVAH